MEHRTEEGNPLLKLRSSTITHSKHCTYTTNQTIICRRSAALQQFSSDCAVQTRNSYYKYNSNDCWKLTCLWLLKWWRTTFTVHSV